MCAPARRPDGRSNDRVGALRSRVAAEGDREELAIPMLSALANPQPAAVAAPGWQFVFVSLAIVILLLEIVHGWRLGLVRQLVRVIAIVVAYSCAFFAARATVPLMRSFFKLPDPIL